MAAGPREATLAGVESERTNTPTGRNAGFSNVVLRTASRHLLVPSVAAPSNALSSVARSADPFLRSVVVFGTAEHNGFRGFRPRSVGRENGPVR